MGIVVIDDSTLTNIADAIREMSNKEDTLYPSEMPDAVKAIADEATLAHWNAITNYGTRTVWATYSPFPYANFDNIKFPKPIVITGIATNLFRLYQGSKFPRKEDIDMSGVTACKGAFSYIYHTAGFTIPDYGIPAIDEYDATFTSSCQKKIEIIRCHKGTTFSDTVFESCNYLVDVSFEGEIGQNIKFSSSPLTVECMKHIISNLVNYAGTENEFVHKVTFTSACLAALEAEGNTSPNGNTWLDYMTDLGWNH